MPFRSVFMTLMIKLPRVPTLCYVFQEVNASLQQENRTMEKEVFVFFRFSSSLKKDGRKQSMSQPTPSPLSLSILANSSTPFSP